MRSRSRSTIETNRRACTRPADNPRLTRRHSTGADLVAIEAIENAPGLGCVDEAVVDAARIVDGMIDRGLGDLVEHHPLDGHLRLQILQQVPADRFALAILVRCEIQLAGVLMRRSGDP